MTTSDVIQIALMTLLVVVTGIYAWRTHAMSKATREQAKASVKMAEEMKAQRLAVKPFVIPDIDIHHEQKDHTEKMRDIVEGNFPVVLTNVGTATAIELRLLLIAPPPTPSSAKVIMPSKLPLLLQGASWRTDLYYVYDVTPEGEPIFGNPPPEGKYELIATFKSIAHQQERQIWEVSLPFDLHLPHGNFGVSIIRGELRQKLLEGDSA